MASQDRNRRPVRVLIRRYFRRSGDERAFGERGWSVQAVVPGDVARTFLRFLTLNGCIMARGNRQFDILSLLFLVAIIALLIAMYSGMWKDHPLGTALVTTVLFSMFGMVLQRGGERITISGAAVVSGIGGANLAMVLHFFFSYTRLESFEDQGLGFLHTVLLFVPVAAIVGAVVGGVVFKAVDLGLLVARRHVRRHQ